MGAQASKVVIYLRLRGSSAWKDNRSELAKQNNNNKKKRWVLELKHLHDTQTKTNQTVTIKMSYLKRPRIPTTLRFEQWGRESSRLSTDIRCTWTPSLLKTTNRANTSSDSSAEFPPNQNPPPRLRPFQHALITSVFIWRNPPPSHTNSHTLALFHKPNHETS